MFSSTLQLPYLLEPVASHIPQMKHWILREETCPAHGHPASKWQNADVGIQLSPSHPCTLWVPSSLLTPFGSLGPFPRAHSCAGRRAPGAGNGGATSPRKLSGAEAVSMCPAGPQRGSCLAGMADASGMRSLYGAGIHPVKGENAHSQLQSGHPSKKRAGARKPTRRAVVSHSSIYTLGRVSVGSTDEGGS